MLTIVVVSVALIILVIALLTNKPPVGLNTIAGKRNSIGFEPNVFQERKMYNKAVYEKFSNRNSLHTLINGQIYTPQGTSVPFEIGKIPNKINTNNISVNGRKDGPKSMFMFAYNKYSPACCPSTYSTSKGCICMTDDQKKFINNRGNITRGNIASIR